jgi:HEAT repeat protein
MKSQGRVIAIIFLLLATAAVAQKPKIANAKADEASASGGLQAAVNSFMASAPGPAWIGYRIPAQPKERTMCCWDSAMHSGQGAKCCTGCRMDADHGVSFSGTNSDCALPEPVPYAFVFLKTDGKQILRVRVFSADCSLDFANLPLHWLEDVKPEQSIDLLLHLVAADKSQDKSSEYDGDERRVMHQAVMALALHDVPAADAALEKLLQPAQPGQVRQQAAFWLAVERSKPGYLVLRKYVMKDSDDRFREKGTFALSQVREPEAVQDLLTMARTDASTRVRSQAIFWLAQKGGRKAAQGITDAIENDPETAVKRKAVFALSQMHEGDGVSMLIQVARTNRNPVVRKEAIFWLGQSHDERALNYLEEILTK